MDNTEDFFKNYKGKYSQYWIERWGLIPELPTSFDNANSMYELVAWLQRAFKNGYSLLVTTITNENKDQLKMAQAYFNLLQTHYQKTIKIENKEVQ